MLKHKPSAKAYNESIKILLGLLKLLLNPAVDAQALIQYMEQYKIDPNVYLPTVSGNIQLPIIYYCCSRENLVDFLGYLLERQVNLHAPMSCDNQSQQIELLYYSQTQYIPALVENGCRLDPNRVVDSVEKLVIKGNIIKLITLYKYNAISKEQINMVLQKQGILFRVLDQLYEKVYMISRQINNEEQFNKVYDELLKNYINTFKFFFKNGINVNQMENGESFTQKVLNTYFVPLVQFVVDYQPNLDTEEVLHYSNFQLSNRQVMHFIYTEDNYKKIIRLVKDKLVPKKINLKKNLVRKVVQIG